MNKRIILAPLFCIILFCASMIGAAYIGVSILLCPLFLMLFGAFALLRNSKITLGYGVIAGVVATFFVYEDFAYSLVYVLGYILAGFTLCYSALRGKEGKNILLTVLMFVLLAGYGSVVISDLAKGKMAFAFINEMFSRLNELKPVLMDTFNQNAELAAMFAQLFDSYILLAKMMMPAIISIGALFITIVLSFLVKVIVNRIAKITVINLRFSMFKADGITVFVFLISALVSMFAGSGKIAVVFTNIYLILNVVLMLCGMSLSDWFLRDKAKLNIFVRFIIIAGAFLLLPFAYIAFAVLALIDSSKNFRKIGNDTRDK